MTPEEFQIVTSKLVHFRQSSDSNPDAYLPSLPGALTKAGKPRLQSRWVSTKSKEYWQAQCSFRNLKVTGSVEELQARMRTRNTARDPQIAEHLKVLERLRNDHIWPTLATDGKRDLDPERWLKETFSGCANVEPLVLRISDIERGILHKVCETLGLGHKSADVPPIEPGLPNYGSERWLVVGADARDVSKKIADISRDARVKQVKLKEKLDATTRQRQAEARARHAALAAATRVDQGTWDLTGRWSITLPDVSLLHRSAELSMDIWHDTAPPNRREYPSWGMKRFRDQDEAEKEESSSRTQEQTAKPTRMPTAEQRYYAIFDFEDVEGIARISGPVGSGKPDACVMSYRWRGREAGENMLADRSDDYLLRMVFSERGTRLSGDFGGSHVGPSTFTGVKVEAGNNQQGSSEYRWERLSGAYESEYFGRWGKRR
ncbi:hypothetical protein LTR12_014384 [Friedmanniomyces endolithicus]|nr:hypothetical protein LTR74_006693 [Friedmanniomyces endolithicus]KAK1811231.1 hypothetical protein LTR12_014384 [Friedmanniomyces endolithicus]